MKFEIFIKFRKLLLTCKFLIVGLGSQFESCSKNFVDEEITGKALLTINAEYLNKLPVSYISGNKSINEYSNNSFTPMNQFLTVVHDQVSHPGLVLQSCNCGQKC